jgi:hypothetical protein
MLIAHPKYRADWNYISDELRKIEIKKINKKYTY